MTAQRSRSSDRFDKNFARGLSIESENHNNETVRDAYGTRASGKHIRSDAPERKDGSRRISRRRCLDDSSSSEDHRLRHRPRRSQSDVGGASNTKRRFSPRGREPQGNSKGFEAEEIAKTRNSMDRIRGTRDGVVKPSSAKRIRNSKYKYGDKYDSLKDSNSRMVIIPSPTVRLNSFEGTSTSESDPKVSSDRFPKLNSKVDRSAKVLKCPLCFRPFDCPILLPCAHSFCKTCISILVEASDGLSFQCPICSVTVPLKGAEEELFCPNFIILKQTEQEEPYDELACSSCDQREASYICADCADGLCSECLEAHRIFKYTKDHLVKRIGSKEDFENILKKRYFCNEHANEQLRHFCLTCDRSICRECAFRDHKGESHSCVPISEAAKHGREGLRRTLFNLQSCIPKLHIALMDIKRVKRMLKKQAAAVTKEISDSIKRLATVLQEREKSLLKDVDEIYSSKCKHFGEQRNQLLIDLERYEASKQLLLQMSDHDSDVELLQMKSTVEHVLRDLEASKLMQIEVDKSTLFLSSNEAAIKKEIEKHGGMQVRSDGKETAISVVTCNADRNGAEGSEAVLQSSRKGGGASKAPSQKPATVHELAQRQQTRQYILSLKSRANWLTVKSRINEIIRYGEAKKRLQFNVLTRKLKSLELSQRQRAEARSMKARANWLLVKMRLNEVIAYGKGWFQGRNVSPKETVGKVYSKPIGDKYGVGLQKTAQVHSARPNRGSSPKPRDYRVIRRVAISKRANANWLIVRSRLWDIRQYARKAGLFGSLISINCKTHVVVRKLKNVRGKILRARANWLLLASRLPDIIAYRREIGHLNNRGWKCLTDGVASNKVVAYRSKLAATKLRSRANWLLVKSRLKDIVWYGEIRRLSKTPTIITQGLNQRQDSRSWKALSSAPNGSSRNLRNLALSKRAQANWLLVKSWLPKIAKNDLEQASSLLSKPSRGRKSPSSQQNMEKLYQARTSPNKPKRAMSVDVLDGMRNTQSDHRVGSITSADSRSLQALSSWEQLIERSRSDYFTALVASQNPQAPTRSKEAATISIWRKFVHDKKIHKESGRKGSKGYQMLIDSPKGSKDLKVDDISFSASSNKVNAHKSPEIIYGKIKKDKPGKPVLHESSWDPLVPPSTPRQPVYENWEGIIDELRKTSTRSHFNWMLVRLRLRDIIEYGRRRGIIQPRGKTSLAHIVKKQIEKERVQQVQQKKSVPTTLLESVLPTKGAKGEDTRTLHFKVRDHKGQFQDVDMQLASPDQSILSAHMAENIDGTFTIYCCPRIDQDFNIFISLSNGKLFKRAPRVLNFFGSFAGLNRKEIDLACRTICLVRWHFTPGLLTKKGDKIVPRKPKRTQSNINI